MFKHLVATAAVVISVLITAYLLATPRAVANSERHYTACTALTLWKHPGKEMNAGKVPTRVVKIPTGWTPVGGGSGGDGAVVIVCR